MAPILYAVETSPPCRAVFMLAKAIGLTLDIKYISFEDQEHLKPYFLKLNPQHTVPTLDDEGFVIWDSHAINIYLINKYAKDDSLYPTDLKRRALIDQRLHFDSGVAFAVLFRISRPLRFKQSKVVPENLKAEVREAYGLLNVFLEGSKWICGDSVTVADIQLTSTFTSMQIFEPLTDKYSNVKRWLNDCSKEPWYEANIKGLEARNKLFTKLMG